MMLRRTTRTVARQTVRAGFTLAELLAVVAILAILAGVAIPTYISLIGNQREKVARTECKKFSAMLTQYAANHQDEFPTTGGYPAQSGGLEILVQDGMLAQLPLDPWQKPYFFELSTGPTGIFVPVVFTTTPDNRPIRSDDR
ncbi:MAG TPA: prepilin-type N-terminal cleavage/methylation domain-containing protein [Gemmatales bacterium]|nr:prepilin-type N-terminal cleavage/methylation domain-containing protein [Gemmatales bacterium]